MKRILSESRRASAAWLCLFVIGSLLLAGCSGLRKNVPSVPAPPAPASGQAASSAQTVVQANPAGQQAADAAPGPATNSQSPQLATSQLQEGNAPAPQLTGPASPSGQSGETGGPATPAATRGPRPALHPGDNLYLRSGFGGQSQQFTIIDGATGVEVQHLPAGLPAPNWSVIYTIDQQDIATRVRALDPVAGNDGPPLRETQVIGNYQLVGTGSTGSPGGLSPNGDWLVLAATDGTQSGGGFSRSGGATNRFVVLDTAFQGPVQAVLLNDSYRFFAITNDGSLLYLLGPAPQSQGRFGFQIWAYDVKTSKLASQPLVDQNGNPVVPSFRQFAVASPDGQWVYCLGSNANGDEALYALNLASQTVKRIDLGAEASQSFTTLRSSLVAARDNKTVYIVDGASGSVTRVDTTAGTVSSAQSIFEPGILPTPSPRPGGSGGGTAGAGGGFFRRFAFRTPILSADGNTLFVPGNTGVAAIDAHTLSLRGMFLPAVPIETVALSTDGARLYAISAESGQIIKINPQNGVTLAQFPVPGQFLAVLHVETRR